MASKKSTGTKQQYINRVLELINADAAGIDAGAEYHWAARADGERVVVRKFSTMTCGLYELADWLAEGGVDSVAVEATGVYCKPLLEVLEQRGFHVLLAKPSSLKGVNDQRKTDMLDCQWIQLLHTFGLLKGSFRPNPMAVPFRAFSRQRRMLIEHASSSIEHMKKALTQMNIRIDLAVSDVTGKTGMSIIRAILAGERDPYVLAQFRDPRCALSEEGIAAALTGKWAEEHLFELEQAVQTWDHYQRQIAACNIQMERYGEQIPKTASAETLPKARRSEHLRKNILPFDARELFYEILGQDLTQIDGISTSTIATLIGEIGTSIDSFPTHRHFTSWLRLSPGSRQSGGRNRSGRNRSTTNRLATALRVAAQTLSRSDSALGAFYRRMRARLGPQKAINATAAKLARMIYFTLRDQRLYVDPGSSYYETKFQDRILNNMKKKAKKLGYELVKAA